MDDGQQEAPRTARSSQRRHFGGRKSDVSQGKRREKRLVFVSRDGFLSMEASLREKVMKEVKARGWTIEIIPDANIETFGNLIDRVR